MTGYVAFGNDDKPGALTPRVSENVNKSRLPKKARFIPFSFANYKVRRSNLASRSFMGPLIPKRSRAYMT